MSDLPDPDREPKPSVQRASTADYLARADVQRADEGPAARAENRRTFIVAGIIWLALVIATGGNGMAIAGGWLVGGLIAVLIPFVGRFISGHGWRDPASADLAAKLREREDNYYQKGQWATDPEMLARAKGRPRD